MQFLIQHGEKLVAGLFAMLACFALATASWAPTEHNPLVLINTANENKDAISNNTWPEDEITKIRTIPDVISLTRKRDGQIVNVDEFQIRSFNPDLTAAVEKRTAVSVVAPESPLAVSVVFPLAMPPEEEDDSDDSENAGDEEAASEQNSEKNEQEAAAEMLAKKFGLRPDSASGGGRGGRGGAGGRLQLGGRGGLGSRKEKDDPPPSRLRMGGPDGGRDMYGQFGDGMMATKKQVRVVAGVSVTMILDLQKQREFVRQSLHLEGSYETVQNEILYLDVLVERREGADGTGEWEPVSREDLAEILKESIGTDRDIVSQAVTRNSITMPLPRRAAGVWQPAEASHPRVEEFELSEKERELIDQYNQLVAAEIEQEEEAAEPEETKVRGFADYVQTATDFQAGRRGRDDDDGGRRGSRRDDRYSRLTGADGGELSEKEQRLLDATEATADNRLLLVRFMDFTVDRGRTYEYRARVVMRNPNYRYPLEMLEDPSLASTPELVSEWSPSTGPVFVTHGHRTYVGAVDGRVGQRERVSMEIYTDTTETGLAVMGRVRVPVGLPVGGSNQVDVVDLTTDVLEQQETTLRTDELLSSADEYKDRLYASDHPELKSVLESVDRLEQRIPDQICVVDGTGALRLRSENDMVQQQSLDRAEYEGVLEIYKSWRADAGIVAGDAFFGDDEDGGKGRDDDDRRRGGLGMGRAANSSGAYYKGGRGRGGRGDDDRRGGRGDDDRRGGRRGGGRGDR